MRYAAVLVAGLILGLGVAAGAAGTSVLFIGNSFTFGAGSAVQFYRADTVTDLNNEGMGGVPALFKSFAAQAGLDYDVYLETRGGSGLDFHLENKLDVIGDASVGQGRDARPEHARLRQASAIPPSSSPPAGRWPSSSATRNPKVELYLMATWSRADQTYPATGAWFGKPIEAMARDVRAAYDKAAAGAPGVKAVIPVGEAWTRAMQTGVADPNPYDGIEAGKLNLWTYDHYHASTHGYYLEALVVFGSLTGRDPRSLGENECSAYELGLSRPQAKALQQVAFDQLGSAVTIVASPGAGPASRARCVSAR